MDWKCEAIPDRVLRPAADRRAFDLHLAALDWSLTDPIVITGPADIKAANWQTRGLTPFTHQVNNLITFCRRLPVALIADDVGLGKTISAGLILSELIARRRVARALVVCPKVLTAQWVGELDDKFGLTARDVTGAGLDAELTRSTPVVVTTYESARDRLAKIEPGTFQLLILDEAHKLRNLHGTAKPPALATRMREALGRQPRPFNYMLMLTATPIQNKVWDLYSLVDLLKVAEGKANPLGDPAAFERQYLQPKSDGRQLRPEAAEQFRRVVRGCLTRTRRADVTLKFPVWKLHLERVPLAGAERDMIRVVGRHIAGLNPMAQVSLAQALMSSPRALLAQADNMTATGSLPAEATADLHRHAARVSTPAKLGRLLSIVNAHRDSNPGKWRVVVFTVRRETQELIGDTLRGQGVAVGFIRGAAEAANQAAIDGYRADPPRVNVLVSTDAGAEGINLQAGNVLVNYDLPWNPMVVEQRIGRVQRLGSPHDAVVVVNLVGADTVEDAIVGRLLEKLQGVSQALGDVEGILDAAGMDDDGPKSFEAQLRELVVASLRGQDTAAAERAVAADIDAANRMYLGQQKELDGTLGGGGAAPDDGPAPPKLARRPPPMTARDFVLGAKRAEGLEVRELDADTAEATGPNRPPERLSFAADAPPDPVRPVFAARQSHCYLPGKPHFERLVQHWVDHHAHHVADRTAAGPAAEVLARRWCRRQPGCEFVAAAYTPDRAAFQGVMHLRVRAGTGVDHFEKVLRGRVPAPAGHDRLDPADDDQPTAADASVAGLVPHYADPLQRVVAADPEVVKFCRFYQGRLDAALTAAGDDAYRRRKVEGDFRPYVQAEVLGLDGVRYDSGVIELTFRADGVEYRIGLTAVPATGQLLAEPPTARCAVSGQSWPAVCVGVCAATGRPALHHRLMRTTAGRPALPDQLVTCGQTGDVLLRTEAAVSAVSGAVVRADRAVRCELTGDWVLPAEAAASAVSGRLVRRDRLVASALSGRLGRPDEAVVCNASGRAVLRDEAVRSAVTGEWFAVDRLEPSAVSGGRVPPPDLVACERTGDRVLAAELGTCAVTGRRVRADLLVRCAASGRPLLADAAARTDDGRPAHPDEVAGCEWLGRRLLRSELGTCGLTGLTVASALLVDGELLPLRRALDGTSMAATPDELAAVRRVSVLGDASAVWVIRSPHPAGDVAAVGGECRGWFGLHTSVNGAVVRLADATVVGRAVYGRRRAGMWFRRND